MKNSDINKIYILGTSGSGKTYFGNILAKKLNLPFHDSDDIRFIRKFTKSRTKNQRKKLIDKIIKNKKWIIDARGNDWNRNAMLKSDLVIWMQTPLIKRSFRILKRYIKRKGETDEDLKSIYELLKYSARYRFSKKLTGFKEHKNFLEKNNLNYLIIKNNKELNKFLNNLK